jgi:hypothetical protein
MKEADVFGNVGDIETESVWLVFSNETTRIMTQCCSAAFVLSWINILIQSNSWQLHGNSTTKIQSFHGLRFLIDTQRP